MKKELSVIKQIIQYSEEVIVMRMIKKRLAQDIFLIGRLSSINPHLDEINNTLKWLSIREEEYMSAMYRLINPLLGGKSFEFYIKKSLSGHDLKLFTLSSKDILQQYVILLEDKTKVDYVFMLTTFNSPFETLKEGSIYKLQDIEGLLEKIPKGKFSDHMYKNFKSIINQK